MVYIELLLLERLQVGRPALHVPELQARGAAAATMAGASTTRLHAPGGARARVLGWARRRAAALRPGATTRRKVDMSLARKSGTTNVGIRTSGSTSTG